jgi:hypothetical protein
MSDGVATHDEERHVMALERLEQLDEVVLPATGCWLHGVGVVASE